MRDMNLLLELMETIDIWVDENVTYSAEWNEQIRELSRFPGLENQENHIKARLEIAMESDVDNPYTVALINTLIITLESIKEETKTEDNRRFLIYWDESYFDGPTSGILTPTDIVEEKGWNEEARKEVLTLKLHEQYRDTGVVLIRVK